MKKLVRQVGEYQKLYRDDKSGIAWIEDGSTGLGISVHPNIDSSGSVRGMKKLGFWGKDDRTVRSHGFTYNIDILSYNANDKYEMIVYNECHCQACNRRRFLERPENKVGKIGIDGLPERGLITGKGCDLIW